MSIRVLSPEIARAAGMTFGELQGFVAGSFTPDEKQLRDLAQRMGLR